MEEEQKTARVFQWHPAFYACFLKADAPKEDAIKASEITISFVCCRYPYKLVRHLIQEHRLNVEQQEEGIYYLEGNIFPMQLIVTSRLSPEKNLWLNSLTNDLRKENMDRLLQEYGKHSNENLYRSVMNLIVRANREKFEEGKAVCDALKELFRKDIEEARREGRLEGVLAMIADNLEEGISAGRTLEK
ncbi:MAG: hypothetical protein K2O97_10025 [Acetatifactor sp.]|nr:hypothetical protein [Acetatifactor sp.]